MPIFEYNGFDTKGNAAKGLKEADSVKSLRVALRREGILATDINEAQSGFISKGKGKSFLSTEIRIKALSGRVSTEVLALTTRQLGTLLSAGVPMVDALVALIDQIENENLKRIFSEIKSNVNEGTTLADAMEKHKQFSGIYVNLVRAGEASGALEIVLERLSEFLEAEARLKSKVISAMIYPLVMAVVAVAVLLAIMVLVVPKLTAVLIAQNTPLPLQTRFLIWISSFLSSFWWLLLILFSLLIFAFVRWKKTPAGRQKWDLFRLKMPVFGEITRLVAIARFARTFATLLSSGVPVLKSLDIVRNVVANDSIERAIDAVKEAVREGEDIATPLKMSGQFPPMVTHMIAIGEKTGQLENMLNRIASNYEEQAETKVGRMTSILEPLMIVLMGLVAMFIVFSIMGPIMSLGQMKR